MDAVHRFEGPVTRARDGLMALFGAPIATKTMPARSYAALASRPRCAHRLRRCAAPGPGAGMRVGLNSGEWCAPIGNDLPMDY